MFDAYEPAIESRVEKRRRSLVDQLDADELRTFEVFDHVAEALAAEAQTPAAQVNLMGVDHHLVLDARRVNAESLPRKNSLCNYPVADGKTFVVENALEEPRLEDHPNVVGKPHVRFYVSIPLVVDDVPVGSVCAVGSKAHSLEWTSRPALFRMVGLLERLLEARIHDEAGRDNAFEL
ncbi:MAG: GAF domain-containing protein, partial [Bradymonadaceae bacterium]